jgi:hypothetical protein
MDTPVVAKQKNFFLLSKLNISEYNFYVVVSEIKTQKTRKNVEETRKKPANFC